MERIALISILLMASLSFGAITVNESVNAEADNSTTLTLTKPANVANGDYLIAMVLATMNGTPNMTEPAGWTIYAQQESKVGRDRTSQIVYKKITDAGSEPANYTWTNIAGSYWAGGIVRVSGIDLTTPEDCVSALTTNNNWDGVAPCPSVTTATDGALVFAVQFIDEDVTAPAESGSSYTTTLFTELNNSSFGANTHVGYFTQGSAGATPTILYSWTGYAGTEDTDMYQVAFRPAATGASIPIIQYNRRQH